MNTRSPVSDVQEPAEVESVISDSEVDFLDEIPVPASAGSGAARKTAIAVGLVVAALIVVLALGGGDDTSETSALIGKRVPAVAGTDLQGDFYDIDDRRGQWVVVNFFATWCPPCVAEHPELLATSEWGSARGDVELVSVVFNEPDPRPVRQFFTDRGGDWPVIYGSPRIPIDFQVAQIPETFVVSPRGQVVAHVAGETTQAELQSIIEAFEQAGSQTGDG